VLAKDVPVGCLYAIPRLATIDSRKVEWTMDEGIMVSDVYPLTQRLYLIVNCILCRCRRRADKMSVAAHCRISDVIAVMVLKSKALIDGIVAPIGWMGDVISECWRRIQDD
jgi:hypothetical protein